MNDDTLTAKTLLEQRNAAAALILAAGGRVTVTQDHLIRAQNCRLTHEIDITSNTFTFVVEELKQ